jgi:hypothetical protein
MSAIRTFGCILGVGSPEDATGGVSRHGAAIIPIGPAASFKLRW